LQKLISEKVLISTAKIFLCTVLTFTREKVKVGHDTLLCTDEHLLCHVATLLTLPPGGKMGIKPNIEGGKMAMTLFSALMSISSAMLPPCLPFYLAAKMGIKPNI